MKSQRLRNLCFGMLLGLSLAAGAAHAIDVGQKAPEFGLPSSTGKEIKLADFAGKKPVVLFFYVGAFTNT
jgi:cytochrome oxidase Cu insertion factor (SCO1/SenC/PrrC family)